MKVSEPAGGPLSKSLEAHHLAPIPVRRPHEAKGREADIDHVTVDKKALSEVTDTAEADPVPWPLQRTLPWRSCGTGTRDALSITTLPLHRREDLTGVS